MKWMTLVFAAMTLPLGAAPRLNVSTTLVEPQTKIEVVFDKEVCLAEQVGKEAGETWLRVQPGWSGRTVWKATNVLEFVPEEVPQLGTTYQFELVEGLRHRDGSEISGGRLGNVMTPDPGVELTSLQDRWSGNWSARTARHYIVFNGEVDPAEVMKFAEYRDKNNRRVAARAERATFGEVTYSYYVRPSYRQKFEQHLSGEEPPREWEKDDELDNGVFVEPATALPIGEDWHLVIREGLPVEGRPTDAERVESVGAVQPPKMRGAYAQTVADQPRRIVVNFDRKLAEDIDEEAVRVEPVPEGMEVTVRGQQLRIDGDFSERDKWRVFVNRRVRSFDGLALAKEVSKDVEFEHLSPRVALPSDDESQLAGGSRHYRISTVNLEGLRVRIKRLEGEDLVRARQGYRHYTGRGPDGERLGTRGLIPYSLMQGETVADFEVELDNPIDTSSPLYIDWDKVLAGDAKPYLMGELPEEPRDDGGTRPGAFFVEVTGQPKTGARIEKARRVQSLVQLTDLGVGWKLTDQEARAFVFSCRTGEPLAGVRVELFGEDAEAMTAAETDADGIVSLPRGESIRHLRVSMADDQFMTAYDDRLPVVSTWRFPVRYSWYPESSQKRRIFMFTDRSLYRPGEEVHFKGLVRWQHGNDIRGHEQETIRLKVTNPTGVEIVSRDLEISAAGSFDHSFTLPAETVGNHQLEVSWPDEVEAAEEASGWREKRIAMDNARQTMGLRVEEFRRNAFEVLHKPVKAEPGAEDVALDVEAKNFNGQPLIGAEMDVYWRSHESNFYPERYRDYLFGDHRRNDYGYWYHYYGYNWGDGYNPGTRGANANTFSTELDDEGKATVEVTLAEAEFPMIRNVMIQTEITDSNRQTLTRTSQMKVHPAGVHLGVRRLDRLVRVGDRLPLDIVAVDPSGTTHDGELEIRAKLTRKVNEQVRMRTSEGGAVRNETRIEELETATVSLVGGEGGQFEFAPEKTGLHTLELRGTDADGNEFATAVSMHVYGTREYPWAYEDNMRIRLVPEKQLYQPGDTARVLVLSPIEGKALVTIERESVSRSFIIDLDPTEPVIELPLTDDDAPNCYVSVMVIKGSEDSTRSFKEPQLRLGYCELRVENRRDRLKVEFTDIDGNLSSSMSDVETVALMPGGGVTVEGRVLTADGEPAAGAEVTVYAEDEGTLAVVGYGTPDPMSFFYDPRLLQVRSGTSLGMFMAESPEHQALSNKGFFIGGGDGGGGGADPLDDARRDFNPCAFWLPTVITDEEGRFRIESDLPDTLTRYRLIGVAHQQVARFGHAEDAFVVNKPLMVEPQVPRFASEGDRLTLRATVTNSSPLDGEWKVLLAPNEGEDGPIASFRPGVQKSVNVRIPAGKSRVVRFDVDFRNTGEARMKWRAEPVKLADRVPGAEQVRQHSDVVEMEFPVEYPAPLLRQSRLVSLNAADGEIDLLAGLDPALVTGRGHLDVEISRSLLLEATGAIDYLLRYPYGCLEQTTSSLIPWLAVERLRHGSPELAKKSTEEVKKAIQGGVERLLSMQHREGGFGYWPNSREANRWSGSYAGMALVMASEQIEVPPGAIERHAEYLVRQLRLINDKTTSRQLEIAARDLWVLAMAGRPQESYVNMLRDRMDELGVKARCFLAMAEAEAGRRAAAIEIMADPTPVVDNERSWMRWQPDHALQMLAHSAIDRDAPETQQALSRLIADRNPYGHWRTTWVNSWSLLGLAAYAEGEGLDATTLELATGDGTETITVDEENATASRRFALGENMRLRVKSEGFAYVRLALAAKPEITELEPVSADGMQITRLYHRINNDGTTEPLGRPGVGDLVRVDLRVTLPRDDARYLVIEDRLPGNFEAVNTSFGSQGASMNAGRTSENAWRVSHSEIRADRAMFFLDRPGRSGTHTLSYLARVTIEGSSFAPPAKAEPMYDPEKRALSASRRFEVPVAP